MISSVRQLFRDRMDALGYREHETAFTFEDLASTILDGSYHIGSGTTLGSPVNQKSIRLEYQIDLRVFKRGYRTTNDALDDLDVIAEEILTDILPSVVRNTTEIKDIQLESIDRVPLSDSNDNAMFLEMSFTVVLVECFE